MKMGYEFVKVGLSKAAPPHISDINVSNKIPENKFTEMY